MIHFVVTVNQYAENMQRKRLVRFHGSIFLTKTHFIQIEQLIPLMQNRHYPNNRMLKLFLSRFDSAFNYRYLMSCLKDRKTSTNSIGPIFHILRLSLFFRRGYTRNRKTCDNLVTYGSEDSLSLKYNLIESYFIPLYA